MSWQASAWAMDKGKAYELQPITRFVMLTLSNYADKEGNDIYPSLGTLGADTGLSEATLRRHIKILIRVGLLAYGDQSVVAANKKIRPDQRPKCYRLVFEREGQPKGIDFANFGKDPDERPVTERPRTVNARAESDVTGCQTGYQSETQTINPPKKPISAPAPALTEEELEAGRRLQADIAARNAARRAKVQGQPKTESEAAPC